MAKFKFTAITPDGSTVEGVETAETMASARSSIALRDLQLLQVAEKKSVLQFEITRRKVSRKEIMHFSRQLAVFVRAGIPILDGLEVITTENSNKLFKAALDDMIEALKGGQTFADAAAAHPEAFPAYYIGILRTAELTGTLDVVLDQLADYIERDVDARQKISSALVYPIIVCLFAVVTVVVLVSYVMPKFEDFFASLDAKLPLPTRILLNVSHFISTWWWAFLVAGILFVVALIAGSRSTKAKAWRDRTILRLPLLGDLVRHSVLERFCRILSSMVTAGVPLPEALAVTSDAVNNQVFREGLDNVRDSMMRGEGLAEPLAETNLFPAAARQMFRVGEDTGTLDEQLATAAAYFDRELDFKLKRFTSMFEPAVILFAGGLVGFIAIALVSAMYGIFHQVKI